MKDKKNAFLDWLATKQYKKYSPKVISDAMDDTSKYCIDKRISKVGIWDIENPNEVAFIANKLSGMKLFRILHKNTANMFEELPKVFHESALIDRFHGFIKGWNIPRMNDDLKIAGWALNSEYYCSIMHELRNDMSYRAIVDKLIQVPEAADTRDTEAVKRIATAYLKLLFPNVREPGDISVREFKRYCLDRARKMRDTVKYQLGILDVEYQGKDIPNFTISTEYEQ